MGVRKGRQHQNLLEDYRTRYQIVAENTYDWEFWLSPEGRYLYVSPASRRITGYEPGDFIQDPQLAIRMIHPEDTSIFEAHWSEVEKRKQMGEVEFRVLHKDGRTLWIDQACQPIFDREGRYLGG